MRLGVKKGHAGERGMVPFLLLSLLLHGGLLALVPGAGRPTAAGEWPELFVAFPEDRAGALPRRPREQSAAGLRSPGSPAPAAAVRPLAARTIPAVQPVSPSVSDRAGTSEQPRQRLAALSTAGEGSGGSAGAMAAGPPAGSAGEGGSAAVLGGAGAPAFLRRAVPVYPPAARRFGREGQVLLRLTIDDSGRLLGVFVLEGAGFGFTESAVSAVERSTYKPAERDGRFVKIDALLRVVYSLQEP